jgi:hypothetical protein
MGFHEVCEIVLIYRNPAWPAPLLQTALSEVAAMADT